MTTATKKKAFLLVVLSVSMVIVVVYLSFLTNLDVSFMPDPGRVMAKVNLSSILKFLPKGFLIRKSSELLPPSLHLYLQNLPCPLVNDSKHNNHRQLVVKCKKNSVFFNYKDFKSYHVPEFKESDGCLRKAMASPNCIDGKRVPKIVHFIWFGKHVMRFYEFLTIVSAHKMVKPCSILIHGDFLPFGNYWELLLQLTPLVIFVRTSAPEDVYGIKLGYIEHKADVARLKVLREYGGIYLDTDSVVLRPLDDFRNHSLTMCEAVPNYNLANGVLIAERNASFINIWLQHYKNYTSSQWGYHSTILPYRLSKLYPNLIHTVKKVFINPNFKHLNLLFDQTFDWTKNNYVLHLYIRYYKRKYDLSTIKMLNNTIGSVARYVLYGDSALCK